jgi:hypothetical protein
VTDGPQIPEPTELVFVPGSSWAPVLLAAGAAGVVVGLFAGWPYAVAGAIVALAALRAWIRRTGDEIARLPRQQRLSTSVLPAVPLRDQAAPSAPARESEPSTTQ